MSKTKRTPAQKNAWKKLKPWIKKYIKKQPLNIWARRIRKEFNYECSCGCKKKTSLEAHHIYFKAEYPLLKEDLDNGVLLNIKCHDRIHSLYINDQAEYWKEINQFLQRRKKLKSLSRKKRNPSLHKYREYKFLDPEHFQQIVILEEELNHEEKKPKQKKIK